MRTQIDHDRVLNMWSSGFTSEQIAGAMGLWGSETARTIVLRARRRGDPRAARGRAPGTTFRLPPDVAAALTEAASKVGLTPQEYLVEMLLIPFEESA